MHNHDQKARDMARSVLPSTARHSARAARRQIHKAERAAVRTALLDARRIDPDEVELPGRDRQSIAFFVEERRFQDKVGSLTHWAERLVVMRPELATVSPADRVDYFRKLLPNNKIGRHALSHLRWAVGDR